MPSQSVSFFHLLFLLSLFLLFFPFTLNPSTLFSCGPMPSHPVFLSILRTKLLLFFLSPFLLPGFLPRCIRANSCTFFRTKGSFGWHARREPCLFPSKTYLFSSTLFPMAINRPTPTVATSSRPVSVYAVMKQIHVGSMWRDMLRLSCIARLV